MRRQKEKGIKCEGEAREKEKIIRRTSRRERIKDNWREWEIIEIEIEISLRRQR